MPVHNTLIAMFLWELKKKRKEKQSQKSKQPGSCYTVPLYVNLSFLYYVYKIIHIIKGRKRSEKGSHPQE